MIYISICLIFIGLIIRVFSIKQLKGNAHWRICTKGELIQTGIYKYVRHPMYLGGIFDYTGLTLLVTRDIGITFIFFIYLINFIFDRIDREESYLYSIFGNEYLDYIKRTKILIPFIV